MNKRNGRLSKRIAANKPPQRRRAGPSVCKHRVCKNPSPPLEPLLPSTPFSPRFQHSQRIYTCSLILVDRESMGMREGAGRGDSKEQCTAGRAGAGGRLRGLQPFPCPGGPRAVMYVRDLECWENLGLPSVFQFGHSGAA